jgi:iron-sulfur cluster assembly accessory protein
LTTKGVNGSLPDKLGQDEFLKVCEIGAVLSNSEDPTMITVTEPAAKQILSMFKEEDTGKGLRLFVESGGCSGLQYGLALDQSNDGDEVDEQHGLKVLVDKQSLDFVDGATIDFANGPEGTGFIINNPNAPSSCGCGDGGCGDGGCGTGGGGCC